MKKQMLNIGKALSKVEQKAILGGNGSGICIIYDYADYHECIANGYCENDIYYCDPTKECEAE